LLMTESSFTKGAFAALRTGKGVLADGQPMVPAPLDVGTCTKLLDEGGSVFGIRFRGHVPNETSIHVGIQGNWIDFPTGDPGWLSIPPGEYFVDLERSGALKMGRLHICPGEILRLEFFFSKFGITLSHWAACSAWSADCVRVT
jgi:hypothetical protein